MDIYTAKIAWPRPSCGYHADDLDLGQLFFHLFLTPQLPHWKDSTYFLYSPQIRTMELTIATNPPPQRWKLTIKNHITQTPMTFPMTIRSQSYFC